MPDVCGVCVCVYVWCVCVVRVCVCVVCICADLSTHTVWPCDTVLSRVSRSHGDVLVSHGRVRRGGSRKAFTD